MNAYSPPIRTFVKSEAERVEDACCDLCCGFPVREVIDGDRMCQECADKWARGEGAAEREREADLLPLSHPVMREALRDWNEKYARMPNRELQALSKVQNRHARDRRGM